MELISVIGSGRSGSTFLEGLLHSSTTVTAVGEVSQLWEKGVLRDELCGCGRPFSACPFWTEVLRTAFGRPSREDAQQFDRIFSRARGTLLDPRMLAGMHRPTDSGFRQLAQALYDAMWNVGGEQPILDSSKWPAYVAATRELNSRRQHLIHMFRDARGNVHSYRSPKRRPQASSAQHQYLARSKSLLHAIGRWKLLNIQARHYSRRQRGAATIMYEQLCSRHDEIMVSLIDMAGLQPRRGSSDWHSVSGNPVRFDAARDLVREDQRWRSEMKALDRYVTRAMTFVQQEELERAADLWLRGPVAEAASAAGPALRTR